MLATAIVFTFLGSLTSFMVIILNSSSGSDSYMAEKYAKEYNKLNRRLKLDSEIDLESTYKRMDKLRTECLVHKPWYAFWIKLED